MRPLTSSSQMEIDFDQEVRARFSLLVKLTAVFMVSEVKQMCGQMDECYRESFASLMIRFHRDAEQRLIFIPPTETVKGTTRKKKQKTSSLTSLLEISHTTSLDGSLLLEVGRVAQPEKDGCLTPISIG